MDLTAYHEQQISLRKALQIFGIETLATLTQPLASMTFERATLLILKWLTTNKHDARFFDPRFQETSTAKFYILGLHFQIRAIYVRYIQENPELQGQMLHHWNPTTTYQSLTIEEIISSKNVPKL